MLLSWRIAFFCVPKFAKTFARYRGHLGPPGPKLKKESENEFLGPLGPGAQKVENGVEKELKSTVFQLFWLFFDSVSNFLGPGSERSRELIFRLFFQLWAQRAQMTPVAGPGNPKPKSEIGA